MKKIINKNTILGLIVGIIISGITVYAVNTYNAKQINFTPSNDEWKNEGIEDVSDALDYLYDKMKLTFNTAKYKESMGTYKGRSNSIDIKKGKYILIVMHEQAGLTGSGSSVSSSETTADYGTISYSNSNCKSTKIAHKYYHNAASSTVTTSKYINTTTYLSTYYIESSGDCTVTYTLNDPNSYTNTTHTVAFQLIEIKNQ